MPSADMLVANVFAYDQNMFFIDWFSTELKNIIITQFQFIIFNLDEDFYLGRLCSQKSYFA